MKEENGKVGEKKNVRSSRNPEQWTSEHQRALESLIDQITSYDVPFIVHTDASQEGLGAVLYQEQQGTIRVIAYASRTLTPAEKNYQVGVSSLKVGSN